MTRLDPNTIPSSDAGRYSDKQVVAIGRHVTWVGFWVNAALAVAKIAAGVIGRSGAMVADGVHSISDFVTDFIVIFTIGVSRRRSDRRYQYGYGKYETLATMFIAMTLAVVALLLFYEGAHNVVRTIQGEILPRPGIIALIMAFVSIAAKEALFHYTRIWGQRIGSAMIVANAWHHRSDALSSLATLVGIAGAMFLGEHWRVLDPIAAMLVSVFIFIVAVRMGMPSVKELLEISLPADMVRGMQAIISSAPGVVTYHHLRSRRNGARIILDVHVKVNPHITVEAGHAIASEVERRLKEKYGQSMLINIHVEPYRGQKILPDGSCED